MNESYFGASQKRWDDYFHLICEAVSSKSPCLSRKIGAILVQDYSIVATGYNGPARGIPHCGHERVIRDSLLVKKLHKLNIDANDMRETCPRQLMGFKSGTGLEWCHAQHAEVNCLINASRMGTKTLNSILYMNCVIPCKSCFGALINAGIKEIIVDNDEVYDKHTEFLINNSDIKIRKFR